MPAISDQDMNAILSEESKQHRSEFNTNATLLELFRYVLDYETEVSARTHCQARSDLPTVPVFQWLTSRCLVLQVLATLREDEFARKDHLAESLEKVIQQMRLSNSTRM